MELLHAWIAHSRAPWVIMWPFVHSPPTCKPMSNVTFTTWGHPYGELTDVKIRHLLTYHMTLLRGYFVHTARQCKMSRLPTEMVHLAIYMRLYCGLIFLPIIRMNVVLNRTVTVTWDTNTLLECTRCSKARNATQTHHLKHLISSQDSTALFALQWGVFVSCDFLAAKDPVVPC